MPNREPERANSRLTRCLPSEYHRIRRTTWPRSMNRSARPIMSKTSSVRAWTPIARDCRAVPSPWSMMRVRIPRASSSAASTSPVGPAPTTSTWQSRRISVMRFTLRWPRLTVI